MGSIRIGHGYDVHRLGPGRRLIVGGVDIPWEQGLEGHSDADVLCHAVMDSLLGAVAMGDIGVHFPPGDTAYRGANSLHLLAQVGAMLRAKGWQVGNLDATIVAQQPRMAGHIPQMRQNMADALQIAVEAVSVKATTEEGLGFTGTGQGMAAHCVALVLETKQE